MKDARRDSCCAGVEDWLVSMYTRWVDNPSAHSVFFGGDSYSSCPNRALLLGTSGFDWERGGGPSSDVAIAYLAACHELEVGGKNIDPAAAGFVDSVEREIDELLTAKAMIPPALVDVPSVRALIRRHARAAQLTRAALRDAVSKHSALLVVLRGEARALVVVNLSIKETRAKDGAVCWKAFGGSFFADYLLTQGHDSAEPSKDVATRIDEITGIPGVGVSDRVLVFGCSIAGKEALRDPRYMTLDEPEFVFEVYLGRDVSFVGEDVCRPTGSALPMCDVDLVVGYEAVDDAHRRSRVNRVVYAKDGTLAQLAFRGSSSTIDSDDDDS